MPAIHIFEKRTLLGGDDLQAPAVLTMAVRLVQGILLILPQCIMLAKEAPSESFLELILMDPDDSDVCRNSHLFPLFTTIYLGASAAFGFASIVLEYRIWWWSSQGTPTQRQPRTSKVEAFLERKLLVFTILLCLLLSTYITAALFCKRFLQCRRETTASGDDDNGDPVDPTIWIASRLWWLVSSVLVLSQAMEVTFAVLFWVRLVQADRAFSAHMARSDPHELVEELWADRCHSMCQCLSMSTCFLFGGQDLMSSNGQSLSYYEHLSRALADYLETGGTLDVVPTDLMTGLLVLQRLQRQRILHARLQVVRTSMSQHQFNHRMSDIERSLSGHIEDSIPRRDSDRQLIRRASDLSKKRAESPLTLRSRGNETKRSGGLLSPSRPASAPSSLNYPLGITKTGSSSSLDVPETARLVNDVPSISTPTMQPVFRRLESDLSASVRSTRYYQRIPRAVLNPHNPVDCKRLEEGARMAKYALSIYTWMLYLFVNPVTGLPKLLCRSCQVCSCCKKRARDTDSSDSSLLEARGTTVGDNICAWYKHSLLLVAGLDESDLVYAQFLNRFSLVPYCIFLDHNTQSVVLSIRGSLSLEDLVTDVSILPECVDELGREFDFESSDQYCHAGVLACARNLYADLERHGLLEQLVQQEFPEYDLRLVGHSLGAGVATLLGYMLRSRFPTLQVFGFSPPGCSMSWDLATKCEGWTTTFVLDSDIVPRLSVLTLERLRDEVLELVGRLKVPKYQVAESFWSMKSRNSCCLGTPNTSDAAQQDLEELTRVIEGWLDDAPPDSSYHQQLNEFMQVQRQRKDSRGSIRNMRLYPPGRMIHLVKTGEDAGCGHMMKKIATCCTSNSGFQYTPVYIANDDLDEIVVSPTMATDHFVDRMADELSSLSKRYAVSEDLFD